jgi:folylpolyglutamate synthase/dihydropteroate synthase
MRLTRGALVDLAGLRVWLDGGHNPAAGKAGADVANELASRRRII